MSISGKVRSDAWFSLFQFIVSISRGLITIPLITQLLGEDSYGVWATAFAAIGLLVTLGEMHLHGALIRYSSQESTDGQTYSDTLLLATITGAATGIFLLMLVFSTDIANIIGKNGEEFESILIVSSAILFLNIILKINMNYPRSRGFVKHYELLRVSRNLLETVVLAVVFVSGFGVLLGLVSLAVLAAVLNLILVSLIWYLHSPPRPDLTNYRRYLSYCLPLVPHGLSKSILQNTDRFLIIYFMSPSAVGIYAVAYSVSEIFKKFTGILNSTLYPTVSSAWDEGNFNAIQNLYSDILRYYSIIAIPALIGLIFLAEPILSILATDVVSESGSVVLPIIALGFLLRGYDNPLSYILTSVEKTDIIGKIVAVAASVNVLLNFVLIPAIGIYGAAVATLASSALILLFKLYYSYQELQFSIPTKVIAKSIFSTGVMYLALYLVPGEFSPFLQLLIYPLIGVVVYFTVLYLINGIDRDEMTYFIDRI